MVVLYVVFISLVIEVEHLFPCYFPFGEMLIYICPNLGSPESRLSDKDLSAGHLFRSTSEGVRTMRQGRKTKPNQNKAKSSL